MALEVLKEISAALLRFFKGRAAEFMYEEKHKVWHAKSIAGRRLATSGWKEKTVRKPDFLDALETAAPETLARLKSRIRAETRHGRPPKRLFMFPTGRSPRAEGAKDQPVRQAFLMIPAGRSLSHNLSRFELRERVKELTCMYNIANLAMTSDPNTDRFLQ